MCRILLCLFLALPAMSAISQTVNTVGVHVEVIADSSNRITAELQIAPNTNGRDLMERLFKMEYMDFSRRFVVGVAGFRADAKQRKYWKIEIDGAASQVGLAEIVLIKDARLRFSIAGF